MAWAKPQFTRGQVDSAGDTLIGPIESHEDWEKLGRGIEVINNWRSSHGFPLQCLKMTLIHRAKSVYPNAVVAQRLKRLPSIAIKLNNNKSMQLSQMHDIGGCRAVLRNVSEVERLVRIYEKSVGKNPKKRAEFVRKYDYIAQPKTDGYRSVHLVYKYRTSSLKHADYNGLRIEIQIRSRLQHAWATAVETVSTFTGRSLRSNIGDESWKRFFKLMGSAIAFREKRTTVPGTPRDERELLAELRTLSQQLQIERVLRGWNTAIQKITERAEAAHAYLLTLDANAMTLLIRGFQKDEMLEASNQYSQIEKEIAEKPEMQAVLVSVDSIKDLKRAYPNYFLDTNVFIEAVKQAIS